MVGWGHEGGKEPTVFRAAWLALASFLTLTGCSAPDEFSSGGAGIARSDRVGPREHLQGSKDRTRALIHHVDGLYKEAIRAYPTRIDIRTSYISFSKIVDKVNDMPSAYASDNKHIRTDVASSHRDIQQIGDLFEDAKKFLTITEAARDRKSTTDTRSSVRRAFRTTSFQCLENKSLCHERYGWLDCELIMLVCVLERIVP